MPGRRPEPGNHQQGSHLVAVQGGGMRLLIQPRPPDMRGRGMVQEFLLHRVLAEPGDGAQPAGDGGPGTAPGFQLPGKAFDVGPADREQRKGADAAPAGELAQVQGVRLARQPTVAVCVPGISSTALTSKVALWLSRP